MLAYESKRSDRKAPYVGVVDKVGPRDDRGPVRTETRVSVGNTLHVGRQSGDSIQRLSTLSLVGHLAHIHIDLSSVLSRAVEAHCWRFR
jgi:hypothetical protein